MQTGFQDVTFILCLFERIEIGRILVNRLYSVNELGGGTQGLSGFWEWTPGCINNDKNTCVDGIPTPTSLQKLFKGGWHWQREKAKSHVLLTKDHPHSENAIGAICDVNWARFLTENSGQSGAWLLKAGSSEFGGTWRAGTEHFSYPDRRPGERLEQYLLRSRHL